MASEGNPYAGKSLVELEQIMQSEEYRRPAQPEPFTMDGMLQVIARLREQGFSRYRQTICYGDEEAFRRWAAEHFKMVKDDRLAAANRMFGIDVLLDVELPPDVIELREGDRVVRRMVLGHGQG